MAMDRKYLDHMQSVTGGAPVSILQRQMPLRKRYKSEPEAAWVLDQARTIDAEVGVDNSMYTQVVIGEGYPVDLPVCVHTAVGGESDFPNPGEILAAALAGCLDMTIRMIANLMGIRLVHLEVHAGLGADVRGSLMTGDNVPVGFQNAQMRVELEAGPDLPEAQLNTLLDAAERSCVVLQTLRAPPEVTVERVLAGNGAATAG
jgi:uncharacterized OsmC-like protein